MKKRVTITGISLPSFSTGDRVLLKKEPENSFDQYAIEVLSVNGMTQLGYVSNSTGTILPNTIGASEIHSLFENKIEAVIVGEGKVIWKNGQQKSAYIAEVTIERRNTAMKEILFKLVGAKSTYPNKLKVMDEFNKAGKAFVSISLYNDKLIGKFDGIPCGYVEDNTSDYAHSDELKPIIKDGEVIATVIKTDGPAYICSISVEEKEWAQVLVPTNMSAIMEQLINDGVVEKTELEDRIDYMKSNKVTDLQITSILKTYRSYDEKYKAKMYKPKTLFVNSDSILNRSIMWLNIGRNLLLQGDRGVGKNNLTETLAWLFHRPLLEFGANAGHDNTAMLGGKTFEVQRDESGRESTKMEFEPEIIVEAAMIGGMLVIDEFNMILGNMASVFNSLFERDRRRLHVPGFKTVYADPNFISIITQNKGYVSTFENNEATKDRFICIKFPHAKSIKEMLIRKLPHIPISYVEDAQKLYADMLTLVDSGRIEEKSITIRGFIDACEATTQGFNLKDALLDAVAGQAVSEDDGKQIIDAINAIF